MNIKRSQLIQLKEKELPHTKDFINGWNDALNEIIGMCTGGIYLNIGCHDIQLKNFINIDIDPAMKPDLVLDVFKLQSAFEENSVDFIYCGHFLEHFIDEDSLKVAKIIHHVLKPLGTLICIIPDFKKAVELSLSITELEGIILAAGLHKSLYTEDRLKEVLKQAGFGTVSPINVEDIRLCRFPNVLWQSGVIAIKHSGDVFSQI